MKTAGVYELLGQPSYIPLIESSISFGSKVIAKVKFFSKIGQKSRFRSQGENFWHGRKGLVTRKQHV